MCTYTFSFLCCSLQNFSKFSVMMGMGRDITSTPEMAQKVPISLPSPDSTSYRRTNIQNVVKVMSSSVIDTGHRSQLIQLFWAGSRAGTEVPEFSCTGSTFCPHNRIIRLLQMVCIFLSSMGLCHSILAFFFASYHHYLIILSGMVQRFSSIVYIVFGLHIPGIESAISTT